jgi:hypothetical protein
MQIWNWFAVFFLSFAMGGCSSAVDEQDGEITDADLRPWDSERETEVAASGELAITLSTGTFEAAVQTSSYFPSSDIFKITGVRTAEDLRITVEVAADAMVRGATLNCGAGGDAEVIVSMDLSLDGQRGVFSSHDGLSCELSVSQFGDVGGVVSGTFSGQLVDVEKALELNVYQGYFDTTRGSTY